MDTNEYRQMKETVLEVMDADGKLEKRRGR